MAADDYGYGGPTGIPEYYQKKKQLEIRAREVRAYEREVAALERIAAAAENKKVK